MRFKIIPNKEFKRILNASCFVLFCCLSVETKSFYKGKNKRKQNRYLKIILNDKHAM